MSCDKIISDLEIDNIIKRSISPNSRYKLIKTEVRPAAEGLVGFLGEHLKMLLDVEVGEVARKINLFIKRVPAENELKAAFINDNNFFSKEAFVFELLEEITTGSSTWCPITYLKNEKVIVMPDLECDGYTTRSLDKPFDIIHVSLTFTAVAQFHAAFANHVVKKTDDTKSNDYIKHIDTILTESTFKDTPWTRTGAKLHKHFLNTFSTKYKNIDTDLYTFYAKAFDTFHYYDDTLNVLVHKDLWANNIMFKYQNGVPTNALLIDFQLVRYAPPAFDIMIMLYMTTTKDFRARNEEVMLKEYFKSFMEYTNTSTQKNLIKLNYNWVTFRKWCEEARMIAMVVAALICQFGLIDPKNAKNLFDNKETFGKIMNEDRNTPIVEYARGNLYFRTFILELFEEFVDTYVQKNNIEHN